MEKRKMQFSKKLALLIVIFSMAIVFYTITINAVLLFLGKAAMAQETVATITTFGAITSTAGMGIYGALTGWRDHSKNKHGITQKEMDLDNNGGSNGENQLEAETVE